MGHRGGIKKLYFFWGGGVEGYTGTPKFEGKKGRTKYQNKQNG